jgi:hypothetical protein
MTALVADMKYDEIYSNAYPHPLLAHRATKDNKLNKIIV